MQNQSDVMTRDDTMNRRQTDPFCTCVRGEWGQLCPECGQRLPPRPGPLQSWHATRAIDAAASAQARATVLQTQSYRHWHL